jgi:predicted CopG family antitoxin
MPSRTVSLEESAYERLKAAKAPDESFSEAIHRLLADSKPSIRQLAGFFTAARAEKVRSALRRMRELETPAEERRVKAWRRDRGVHSRH